MILRLAMLAAALCAPGLACAQNRSQTFEAVVCISEGGGPWTRVARGTLTRSRISNGLAYRFDGGGQPIEWRFTANADGNTTISGPGSLLARFLAAPPKDRRQRLQATGEIHEDAAPYSLMLRIGPACPGGGTER